MSSSVNLTVLRKVQVSQVGADSRGKSSSTLNDVWSDCPATVVLFLRRFHCPYAKLAAAEVSKIAPELASRGVRLVGVGSGWAGAEEFRKREYLSGGDLFVDEKGESFVACGFKVESVLSIFNMVYSSKARRETSRAKSLGYGGHFKLGGNGLQQGGVLIVDGGGGRVVKLWRQTEATERCDNVDILSAIDKEIKNSNNSRKDATAAVGT